VEHSISHLHIQSCGEVLMLDKDKDNQSVRTILFFYRAKCSAVMIYIQWTCTR